VYIKNYPKHSKEASLTALSDNDLSRGMQEVMLPQRLPSLEGVELGVYHAPGSVAGCDLFDILPVSSDVYAFLLFDTQDSGMRSTLISATAKICFGKYICPEISPFTVLEHVHHDLQHIIGIDLKLSAFLGYLDLHDNELVFSSCGTITPVVYRSETGDIERLYSDEMFINSDTLQLFEEDIIYLKQGDSLMIYTDGVHQLFPSHSTRSVHQFMKKTLTVDQVAGFISDFHGLYKRKTRRTVFDDDTTLVCVEILTQSRKNRLKEKLGFAVDDMVYLQFLNYLEEMDRSIGTVLTAMDATGYPDEAIRKMKIVLTELLVNAIIHGNRRNPSRRVVMGHVIRRKYATVSIMDEGTGFDPSKVPDPTLPENLERPCGRGIYIVRHYVESVVFNAVGNRVTITKFNELVV
jgi:serine/threonine-protein kinase RsbW